MKHVRTAVLVSASPRRKALLEAFVPHVRVLFPGARELPVKGRDDVLGNARAKMGSVHVYGEADVVLAADTAVFLGKTVLGKPSSSDEASAMLRKLSGKWHEVTTALVVDVGGVSMEDMVTTRVHFRELDAKVIEAYVATGEPLDKAGAYGIQGMGGLLVDGIEGDYFNVVGLPLFRLEEMLERQGFTLIGQGGGR